MLAESSERSIAYTSGLENDGLKGILPSAQDETGIIFRARLPVCFEKFLKEIVNAIPIGNLTH